MDRNRPHQVEHRPASPDPSGPAALVTGAGRGLGAAIAEALAAAGHSVAVNDLPASPGAVDVAARIRDTGGVAEPFGADVTNEDAVRRLVADVHGRFGPIGILVVNATGPQPALEVEQLPWTDLLDPLLYFVKSPTLLVQAVPPAMQRRGAGRIINVGSDLPERALPGFSADCAAKAAQLALTRVWARELARHGVTVNLVAPGWIPVERHADVPAEVLAAYAREVPSGRLGVPGDVASAVAFLASDAAGFITGERIAVNGGHTLA